ncbi:MAG: LysE family transporter [Gammaproteobacteria bacterium]|nr:LysE family transporter [Gammaproteobacteria bacterium]
MALLGFGVVFELFPFLYVGAKAAGAAYLLYIAFRMWRSARVPATSRTSGD